nr:basic salivary proline-rich protein 1-like [Odocoileus virginianus texanus]
MVALFDQVRSFRRDAHGAGRGDGGVTQAPPPPQTEVSSFSPLGGATEPPPSPGAERDPPTPPARSRSRALPLVGGPAPRRRGLSHDERETARDSQSPGSSVDGGEGSRPDSSPNFSRPPRRERRRKQSGGGEVESGIQGGPGAGGKSAPVRSGGGTVDFPQGGGLSLPPPPQPQSQGSPCVGYLQGLTPPAVPALAARSPPPRPARGSQARPRLTGRGWLDRPTGWGARRGRRAVLKLWVGTARSPSSLSLAPSLLPPSPSFPDTASRGVMSGARRADGEGPREAGGGPGRGRPEPGERPQPQPAPLRSFGQLWGRAGSPVRGEEGGSGRSKALCAAFARLPPPLRVFSPFSPPSRKA